MKDIIGYENLYAITEDGKVWSHRLSKFLNPTTNKDGHLQINLSKNGTKKRFYLHRLVAETYLPNPNNLPEVHHINGIRNDNRVDNLDWVSKEENISKRIFNRGAKWYMEKLKEMGVVFTPEQIKYITGMG